MCEGFKQIYSKVMMKEIRHWIKRRETVSLEEEESFLKYELSGRDGDEEETEEEEEEEKEEAGEEVEEEQQEKDDDKDKLTLQLGHTVVRGVGAVETEEALGLQDENQRAPSEQHATEAQALQQARDQREEVSRPHGGQLA